MGNIRNDIYYYIQPTPNDDDPKKICRIVPFFCLDFFNGNPDTVTGF